MAAVTEERRSGPHPSVSKRTPCDNADFFNEHELRELREYIAPVRRLRRIRVTITTVVDLAVIFLFDLAPKIADALAGRGWLLQLIAVAAVVDGITTIIKLPFSAWVNLRYEKRAGHSTITVGTFVKDQVLEFVLGMFVIVAILGPTYWAMRSFDLWWLVASLVIVAFLVTLRFVAPVVIMPRFNKFTPLPDGPIRTRIEELAARQGVKIEGVYLMDASKRTNRANAGVTGFGKTKRVIVNDTICDYPMDELSQVIAHELGHYRLGHPLKSMPVEFLALPLALLFIEFVVGHKTVLGWAGVSALEDPGSYGVLGLGFGLVTTAFGLFEKWMSRKYEREADLEALELLGDPTSFVAVWPRMVLTDKANLEPTPWEKANSTHPEIAERMQFALDWAAMNDVPVEKPAPRPVPERNTEPVGQSPQ